jgi:hypothetical protein
MPRAPLWEDHLDPTLFFSGLVSRSVHTSAVAGHPYHWPEYVFYPGVLLLLLVAWDRLRRVAVAPVKLPAGLFVLFGFLLMIGDFPMSPSRLLGMLPLVGDLQVPSRFAIVLLFGLVIWGAQAADHLLGSGLLGRRMAVVLLALVVAENWSLSGDWLSTAPTGEAVAGGRFAAPTMAGSMVRADITMDRAPALGRVVSNCYEPGPKVVPRSLHGDQEVAFLTPAASVAMQHPGAMTVQSDGPVVVAQAFHEHWQAEGGRVEASADGLTRVVAEGAEVRLRYQNPFRRRGLWVQLGTGLLLLGLYVVRRRKRVANN